MKKIAEKTFLILVIIYFFSLPVFGNAFNQKEPHIFLFMTSHPDSQHFIPYKLVKSYDLDFYRVNRFYAQYPVEPELKYIELLTKDQTYPHCFFDDPRENIKIIADNTFACQVSIEITELQLPSSLKEKPETIISSNSIYKTPSGKYIHLEVIHEKKFLDKTKKIQPHPASVNNEFPNVIETPEQARKVFEKARYLVQQKFGMGIFFPVEITLVKPLEFKDKRRRFGGDLSAYIKTPCKCKPGRHRFHHHIYIEKNLGFEDCLGAMVHELVHAWQYENCPPQSAVVYEGFAQWIEWKILKAQGFHRRIATILSMDDHIYKDGFLFFRNMEYKYGEKTVIEEFSILREIEDKLY